MHRVHLVCALEGGQLPRSFSRFVSGCTAMGVYLGGYRGRVGEDRHSLHFGDPGSDKERGGRITPPDGDVVVVRPSQHLS